MDENTSLRSPPNATSTPPHRQRDSTYGTHGSSFGGNPSIEGLTPTGYEINPCQLLMLGCWLTVGIIPHLAALIVGFDRVDIACNDFADYGLIHPRAYLKLTGIVGIFACIACTVGTLYLMRNYPEIMETIINGRLFEFNHPSYGHLEHLEYDEQAAVLTPKRLLICNKIFAICLIAASFVWCVIGWDIVSKLNMNGCGNDEVTHTILAWTIIQMLLLLCALSSRLVKRGKVMDSEANIDQEEGSVDHKQ